MDEDLEKQEELCKKEDMEKLEELCKKYGYQIVKSPICGCMYTEPSLACGYQGQKDLYVQIVVINVTNAEI